ncbi:hypothetical protein Fmac_009798 [Flemingia macrophylla]|uniref:Ycf15 n=1 Tax=Flemingia macrophylla TaxID=520843 RepID=A0ABD1N1D4_9FABA
MQRKRGLNNLKVKEKFMAQRFSCCIVPSSAQNLFFIWLLSYPTREEEEGAPIIIHGF